MGTSGGDLGLDSMSSGAWQRDAGESGDPGGGLGGLVPGS